MKKLYCMNCGAQVNIKLGIMSNKCSCGAKFDLADTKDIKKITISIISFVILNTESQMGQQKVLIIRSRY